MIRRGFYAALVFIVLALDQLTKTAIASSLPLNASQSIIPGFFNLVHVHNKGAIFGFFSQPGNSLVYLLLTLASLAALGLVIYYFIKTPSTEWLLKVSLSLILAGALGNMIDRVCRGYVIDFLDVFVRNWHWPSFNVADSSITTGALLMVLALFWKRSPKCSPPSSE